MDSFLFHDIAQNDDYWYQLRAGRITSSKLSTVMANYGKAFGPPAKAYARQLACERITGKPTRSSYKTADMDRGHAEEPIARMLYEDSIFCTVTNGGFFASDEKGCSPDGLVGSEGVVEIKSADSHIHYERVKRQSYDPAYKWQCLGNMKWPGRDWLDFISYCSDYPEDKQLYVYRLWAKDYADEFTMMNKRVGEFLGLVDQAEKDIKNLDYFLLEQAA